MGQTIAEIKAKQQRRHWTPSIDFYAGYNIYNQREQDDASLEERREGVVGIKITMDLLDAKKSSAESRALYLKAKRHEYEAEQTRKETGVAIENAQKLLNQGIQMINGTDVLVEQSQQYLKGTLAEYARGVKNSLDVLDSAKKHFEYRKKRLDREYDFQMAAISLFEAVGA